MKIIGRIEKTENVTSVVIESRACAGRIAIFGQLLSELADGQAVYLDISAQRFQPLNEPPLIEEELQDEKRQRRIKDAVSAAMDS